MKFRQNNNIQFGIDHGFAWDIPHGIEFVVERLNERIYRLVAPGYGGLPYGRGAFYVSVDKLSPSMLRVAEQEARKQPKDNELRASLIRHLKAAIERRELDNRNDRKTLRRLEMQISE